MNGEPLFSVITAVYNCLASVIFRIALGFSFNIDKRHSGGFIVDIIFTGMVPISPGRALASGRLELE